jgi:uncharacterized protein (UPF0261 family)
MTNKYKLLIFFPLISTALIACSKVDVETEVRNMITAECKVDKITEKENVSVTEVTAALDEFSKIGEEITNRLKTQDQKDDFLIYYSGIRKQEKKCSEPIFNKEGLAAVKLYMNSQK